MKNEIKLLDVVALLVDYPQKKIVRGQVGTVIFVYPQDHFEVEFAGMNGEAYAMVALPARDLMILHHQPQQASLAITTSPA